MNVWPRMAAQGKRRMDDYYLRSNRKVSKVNKCENGTGKTKRMYTAGVRVQSAT